ncbi:hypothetical protein BLOT_016407 [Blomia tropicalis]|nr:hypothetical protein BLOT_016407 [Blomia tropicalis]
MRTRTLATALCAIFVPSLVIYYVYYDSIADHPLSHRYTTNNSLTNVYDYSHKYLGVWKQYRFNESRRAEMQTLFKTPKLPTPEESKDPNPEIERRRQFVKDMMKDAWSNYVRFAWGYNELKPLTKEGKIDSIFGAAKAGASIVDSLDTLLIMDMKQEFNQAREWVKNSFDFKQVGNEVSVFETVIRFVGGLLTAFAMTGDELFLNKSLHVAEALLPAFNTETGLPYGLVVPKTGKAHHHSWAFGSILSEMGSHHLENIYLSDMTGDNRFRDHAFKIRNQLDRVDKPHGLYMTMMESSIGRWNENKSTLGALGDSFYEYLIKAYVQSKHGDKQALRMYIDAMDAIERNHMINISRSGLQYISDWVFGHPNNKMQHLTCFAGGMYALGSKHMQMDLDNDSENHDEHNRVEMERRLKHHFNLAINITETCFQSYNRTPTELGPETFYFDEEDDATNRNGDFYILRPEVIESYFVMWRLTHDNRYREYAWKAAQALYRSCRTRNGYSGIHNVMDRTPTKDNTQQSFFMAETLKYLYLIFSNDNLISLDEWVFNTEAHPLPICGINSAYPIQLCHRTST